MLPEAWHGVRRVLAVRLDNIGDIVLLGPALRTVRQALPSAHITLLASPAGSQVVPLLPWVDEVWTEEVVWQDASWVMALDPAREQALIERVRAGRFDAALIFTSFSQSPYPPAYVCYLAGVPIRVGESKEFGGSVLSQWVRPLPDGLHQAERNLALLEAAGLPIGDRELELRVPAAVQAAADRKLAARGINPRAPFIVLAPGASCAARRYDLDRFAAVAAGLAAETGLPLVVVGSAREADLLAPLLDAPPPRQVSLAGQTTVPELAAVIRRAMLVLTNNSGPLHMADAFRRPLVVLYSGTELESQWAPRSAPARLLRRPTACSPCYAFACPYHMECLDIPPAGVVAAACDLLAQPARLERALPVAMLDAR